MDRIAWAGAFAQRVGTWQRELCGLMAEEVGKPEFEALTADIATLIAACRWHVRHAGRILADRRVRGGGWIMLGTRAVERREALGRVGIIATWNYPVQLLGIQLVQAVVGGNRVVVKPSEVAPRTQALLLDLARRAGLPGAWLDVLPATREAGRELLEGLHGRVDQLVFTGSTAVGRQIAQAAGARLLPTTLELSGRDSALVLDDADPVLAARAIWSGAVINSGQTCTAPRRALVDRRVYAEFVAALAPLASAERPRTLVSAAAASRCFELAHDAVERGSPIRAGARGRSVSGVLEAPSGRVLRPLAIVDCPCDAALVAGDHFGPVLAVVPVSGEDEMLAIHHRCDQHLSASVFTRSPRRAGSISARLGASFVTVNQCLVPLGHPGATFGGTRSSGWGVSRGREGLLAMTRPVTTTVTSRWIRPPMGEPSRKTIDRVSGFLAWIAGADEARDRSPGGSGADPVRGEASPAARPPATKAAAQGVMEHKHTAARAQPLQDQPA